MLSSIFMITQVVSIASEVSAATLNSRLQAYAMASRLRCIADPLTGRTALASGGISFSWMQSVTLEAAAGADQPQLTLRLKPARWVQTAGFLLVLVMVGGAFLRPPAAVGAACCLYLLLYLYFLNRTRIRLELEDLAKPGYLLSSQGKHAQFQGVMHIFQLFTRFYFMGVILFFVLLVLAAGLYGLGYTLQDLVKLFR